ncbi:MAG TPA: glutathione S-transferase family protein [Candidatus Acidoferrales bacterium]|nr:glutathione S-transferase family protein [Candidatus Acidoferrales bacterium]
MKLYDFTLAPSPRRVRIFLAEKGIKVPLVQVDIMRNANRTPEFYAKNPLGSLPVLEFDDGSCISESVAICRYFEELHPEPPLFGVGARERAIVEMWNRRIEFEIFATVGHVWSHLAEVSKGRGRRLPELGEIQKRAATGRIAWLDDELKSREFVAGERYSIADITTLCMIDFASTVEIRIQPEQKSLARWYASVSARPSATA